MQKLEKYPCSCLDEIVTKAVEAMNKEFKPYKVDEVKVFGVAPERKTSNTVAVNLSIPNQFGRSKTIQKEAVLYHNYCPFCGKAYN